eukprot:1648694-Prymnesium_polylepis.1
MSPEAVSGRYLRAPCGFDVFSHRTTTYAPTILLTHSGPEDAPPLPTPSHWDDAMTVTLLPVRLRLVPRTIKFNVLR